MFFIKFKKLELIIKKIYKTFISKNSYIIGNYTYNDLRMKAVFNFRENLSDEEVNNFLLLSDDSYIYFRSRDLIYDERIFYNSLVRIFSLLESHNRIYNIELDVNNRKLLENSGLLDIIKNIRLTINYQNQSYSLDEYLEEEKILNELIRPLKEKELSNFEKYLAVYNIVKNFKPYKDNIDEPKESRKLKFILKNEYMVCVGYAELLKVLLDKVEISSIDMWPYIDISYDDGFTLDEKVVNLTCHRRNIVKLDDDKYGIHGIYMVDSTWDNNNKHDLYNHSVCTFNHMKDSFNMEKLDKLDLMLDFNNIEEFNEKINFYIRKYINRCGNKDTLKSIIDAYNSIYSLIMRMLILLDYEKYLELFNKYDVLLRSSFECLNNLGYIEEVYSLFLTEYFQYMIKLSNNIVSIDTLYRALFNVKKIVNGYTDEEIKEWYDDTVDANNLREDNNFPYENGKIKVKKRNQ